MNRSPIALFVYNRPWHTRQTVEALQRNVLAGESDLFIFSDAPKQPDAAAGVTEVRAYLGTIGGFKSVNILRRGQNMGLAASISAGVTELCETYGSAIVMEDDLETSAHFLEYMNAALDRYKNDDRVMQIAGHMFVVRLEIEEDALFLPFISSWGWATWARAWRHFDPLATGYERLLKDAGMRKRFDLGGRYRYFKMLQAQQSGKIDSWAIRWYLSVFLRDGLALYPKKALVRNLGFDGSGVNCAVSDFQQSDLDRNFRVVSMPSVIDVSRACGAVYRAMPVPRVNLSSIIRRAKHLLRRGQ